jgi:hypothetical protein
MKTSGFHGCYAPAIASLRSSRLFVRSLLSGRGKSPPDGFPRAKTSGFHGCYAPAIASLRSSRLFVRSLLRSCDPGRPGSLGGHGSTRLPPRTVAVRLATLSPQHAAPEVGSGEGLRRSLKCREQPAADRPRKALPGHCETLEHDSPARGAPVRRSSDRLPVAKLPLAVLSFTAAGMARVREAVTTPNG